MFDNLDIRSIADNVRDFLGEYGVPIGLGAQGLGTFLRAQGLQRQKEAQEALLRANAERQKQLQDQAAATIAATTAKMTPQAQGADRATLAAMYEQMMRPTLTRSTAAEYIPGSSAPQEVADRATADLSKSSQKGLDYAKGLAELTSYDGLNQNNRIALAGASRDINRIGDASGGLSRVLPAQLEAAQEKGGGLHFAADVANGLGDIAFALGLPKPKPRAPQPALGSGITMGGGGAGGIRPGAGGLGLKLR